MLRKRDDEKERTNQAKEAAEFVSALKDALIMLSKEECVECTVQSSDCATAMDARTLSSKEEWSNEEDL